MTCVHPARALMRSFRCCAGIYYGTMLQRLDAFVLRWLPKAVKEPLKRTVSSAVSIGHKGLQATAGRVTDGLVGRHVPDQLASQIPHLSTSKQDSRPFMLSSDIPMAVFTQIADHLDKQSHAYRLPWHAVGTGQSTTKGSRADKTPENYANST